MAQCGCGGACQARPDTLLTGLYKRLSGVKASLVGGLFLLASLILILTKTKLPADPAWAAVLLCGYPLVYRAVSRVITGKGLLKISSSLLITIAMIAAIVIDELFAAGQVAFIMAVGEILEAKTVERAKKGLSNLIRLTPAMGRVYRNGETVMVPTDEIKTHDELSVLPGEAIPVDGVILSGRTSVDQSVITGESLPVDKAAGDGVFCGTMNRFGSIRVKAVKVGGDSSLQKLIRLLREADENKAPAQLIMDKAAAWLVPLTLLIAVTAFIFTRDIMKAVTVMIVFCPCALALSAPTAVMAAIGQAAKHGVIIKSGEALEKMGKADLIAFDKTGTLTAGILTVSDVIPAAASLREADVLSLAASAEAFSEHPLGKAIAARAKETGAVRQPIEDFVMIPGKGISAAVNGRAVLCGSRSFLAENGVEIPAPMAGELERLQKQGKAVVSVAFGNRMTGLVALSDTLRETAKGLAAKLRQLHTETVLLTGDNLRTAVYFAEKAGIPSVYADLLPAEKVACIRALQQTGRGVCMVGDGVNDAPALKTASVGVAMGAMGVDIAVEAADIALMENDLSKILYLKRLSAAAVRLIKGNTAISIVFNVAAITLSLLGILTPVTGALAHNAGAIAVILNAALLYDRKYTD